jgi:HEAT repeat protein
MAYLELCDQFGCVPSPELDDVFEAFVTHYEPAWYGSGEDEHHRRLREALSTIPADRLESILLAPDTLNFWLIGALSSSDDVLNRVVENLASAHNLNWQQQKAIEPGLVSLGTDGLPAFRELIAGDDFDQEQTVVEALAALEADEAAPVLALVLEDRRKTMREPARKGLAELSDDVVLEAIEAPLNASRKHTRLAAAKVLANLPKSDRRYELAQGRLEEERTQDVQDVLEKIEPPGDEEVSDIDREAVFERLEEEDLSGWREIADEIGVEIVRLASEYMARQTLGWSYHDQLNAFYEMIERFADEPETVEHAVGALSHSGRHSEDLLEGICERLDGVLDELHRQLIDTDRLDDSYYLDEQDVVTWIAEEAPDEGRSVLLDILEDRRKTMRRPAIEGLASLGESVVEDVTSLLRDDDTKADGRDAAARTLGEIGSPDALDDLEAALDEEGSSRVAEAIEEAIVSCRGAAVDVTEYDEASELDEALASLEMERPDVMPEEVPTVHWASGEALSEGALDWMLAKLMRENQETHDEQLLAVRARLDDTDCHELCDALLDEAHQTDRGWGLYIQGVIGSDSHIDDLGGTLEDLASSASTNWGTDGVEVLVRHGSDTAAQWLDHWVRKSSRDALLDRARDGLERIAEQRGMSVDDLVLKATPDFGFGASGEQRVDFGSRDIVVRLNADSGLEFEDDEGEVRDWFPSARKADDDEKVQAAKDRFRGMRRRIEQITQGVAERFEDAMITGRTWPLEEWRELFVEQALAFQLTRALLFEYHVGDAETPVRFAVSEEATCLDADGSELDVPEESEIGLAHPLNLDDEALDAWRTHFDERDVEPPFPQLDRETHPPESIPDDEDDLLLELPKIHPRPFMNRLGDLGYQRGSRRDAGLIHDAHTSIGDYWVELDHEGYSPEAVDAIGDVSIEGVVVWERDDESAPTTLSFEREPLDLDELPPRIASEIVRDLERLTEEA